MSEGVHNKTTLQLGSHKVGYGYNPKIIAEGGNNHGGDKDKARLLTDIAAEAKSDYIKWQVRHNETAMSKKMREEPYHSPHSFSGHGGKYGDHREAVEIKREDWPELKKYAEDKGLDFTVSAWDLNSFAFARDELNLEFIKIASGDAKNDNMLDAVVAAKMTPIISTGMCTEEDVDHAVKRLQRGNAIPGIVLMHCTSSYPCPDGSLNVSVVRRYNERYKSCVIGYSGHESDLEPSLAAVAQGAHVLERHITYDRNAKGNDHKCSLMLKDLLKLRRKIDRIAIFNGSGEKVLQPGELEQYRKLGKTLHTTKPLFKGHTITFEDVIAKSPGTGIAPSHIDRVVGSVLLEDLLEDQPLEEIHIYSASSSKYETNVHHSNGKSNGLGITSPPEVSVRV